MTLRVLICDDELTNGEEWNRQVTEAVESLPIEVAPNPEPGKIKSSIQTLIARRVDEDPTKGDCIFDDVDVLILDYDLLHVDEGNTRYTGEGVARLARTWSNCGPIVILNQYPGAQFDLGMRGHPESVADLNVDGDLIGVPGLWHTPPWAGFRPFSWPVLPDLVRRHRELAEVVRDGLDEPILSKLGFGGEDVQHLSDTAFGFLDPGAKVVEELRKVTFRDYGLRNVPALRSKTLEATMNKNPEALTRIVVSRLCKWIDREVLGPQDVLVDLPHLVQRFPFVLGSGVDDPDRWNATVTEGFDALDDLVDEEMKFGASDWLSRDAVWLRRFETSERVREARSDFDFANAPDFVFAEDASRFVPSDDAVEFRAAFHNTHDRRYVEKIDGFTYAPQRRFAFG